MIIGYQKPFDFDSTQPIQAHEVKESMFEILAPSLMEYGVAWNVVLLGAKGIEWVYYGGYGYIVGWFIRFAPGLYNMAAHGFPT